MTKAELQRAAEAGTVAYLQQRFPGKDIARRAEDSYLRARGWVLYRDFNRRWKAGVGIGYRAVVLTNCLAADLPDTLVESVIAGMEAAPEPAKAPDAPPPPEPPGPENNWGISPHAIVFERDASGRPVVYQDRPWLDKSPTLPAEA
jgi:hypothetical protein